MRHDAKHFGKLGNFGAAAAKFARHPDLDETRLPQERVVFRNEGIAGVELGRTRGGVGVKVWTISTALPGGAGVSIGDE